MVYTYRDLLALGAVKIMSVVGSGTVIISCVFGRLFASQQSVPRAGLGRMRFILAERQALTHASCRQPGGWLGRATALRQRAPYAERYA